MEQVLGFGGSCHWCTEAIFQSLIGVSKVEQGWIASVFPNDKFSEAVKVYFDDLLIDIQSLALIHLHTHECTSNHSMRNKYRSAVYVDSDRQIQEIQMAIHNAKDDFSREILTQILPMRNFKMNKECFLDYYYSNPEKPFCKSYINPKLAKLLSKFRMLVKKDTQEMIEQIG